MTDRCDRCGAPRPSLLTRPDGDHLITIEGPLALDRLAARADGNAVTYRASQPYLVVWCSQYEATVNALNLTIERDPDVPEQRERPPE